MMPKELKLVSESLKKGQAVNPVTVREFLAWFEMQRRGAANVERIRSFLRQLGLYTIPDFNETWLDEQISFAKLEIVSAKGLSKGSSAVLGCSDAVSMDTTNALPMQWEHREAGYRLSRLEAAHKDVVKAKPEDDIAAIITKMMVHDFSQIPVMIGKELKGVITWPTIGSRAILYKIEGRAADFMQPPSVIDEDRSIFEAISAVVKSDYVLVRSKNKDLSGIITAADLSLQFRVLSEPFLLISQIETHLRNMIGRTFTHSELQNDKAPHSSKAINSPADLSFGDYVSILDRPANWEKFGIRLDRSVFCEQLKAVNKIRNQVMHFDTDGLELGHLETLRDFSNFLDRIESIAPHQRKATENQ